MNSNDRFASLGGVPSPCVQICVLADDDSICVGCGRTPQEIAEWMDMGDEKKRAVLEASRRRRARRSDAA